jgi:L-threonine kinase
MKIGKGSCNGTFGELVQGCMGERPFLITLPIRSLRSEAVFFPDPCFSGIRAADTKMKAKKAGELLFQQFGIKGCGILEIESNIPVGKGMASSSADMVAALKAIADSYDLPLTTEMISFIAAAIEPTDGVMYEEIVAYDYIHGELIESFGELPPFILVGMDMGGEVNTVEFNQFPKGYLPTEQRQFLRAYQLVREGIRKKDLSFIFKAATMSARMNQRILPKPFFKEVEAVAQAFNGGIVAAHSGTVLGIIIDKKIPNSQKAVFMIAKQVSILFKKTNVKLFYYSSNEVNQLGLTRINNEF